MVYGEQVVQIIVKFFLNGSFLFLKKMNRFAFIYTNILM